MNADYSDVKEYVETNPFDTTQTVHVRCPYCAQAMDTKVLPARLALQVRKGKTFLPCDQCGMVSRILFPPIGDTVKPAGVKLGVFDREFVAVAMKQPWRPGPILTFLLIPVALVGFCIGWRWLWGRLPRAQQEK